MKYIILDTNFLLIPGLFKIDIFDGIHRIMDQPYRLMITEGIRDELVKLSKTKGKNKDAALLALKLIEQKSLYMKSDSKKLSVDDILVEISDKDTVVATQDKELKKRLKEKGVGTIFLRQKKYLEMENVL